MRPWGFGSTLTRKLMRDLYARKASIIVLVLIVMVGVGSLITMRSVYRDIEGARASYYREYRIADFWVDLKRAPASTVQIAAQIPNVKSVQGRIVIGALIELPHLKEPITGQILSLPEERRPVLNDVLLLSGTWFTGANDREVILNDGFAKANNLKPGDRIKVLLLDEQHDVLIVGTAVSPEFVFLVPADGGLAPDPARFAVMYMPEEFLQSSADQEGAYNQFIGTVFDSSPAALDRTLELIADELDPWGVALITPAQDQISIRFLRDEIKGLRISSTLMPGLFLIVAMLILNVLMDRIAIQQRTIIGTLKALGKSTPAIAFHYICFGLVIGVLGGLAGSALTLGLQGPYVRLFRTFYTLPNLEPHFYLEYHVMGMMVSIAFASAGAMRAAVRAARLHPAEAMRPPPPERGGKIIVEFFGWFWSRLSFRWRLVLRAIFRNPFRSTVTFVTTVISAALMVAAFSLLDALDYLMDYQFNAIVHHDVTISLREPQGAHGPAELARLPGVAAVEPELIIGCDLTNGLRRRRIGVTGLPKGNTMNTPLDDHGHQIVMPDRGLVLSDKLADVLDVDVGDSLTMRPFIGHREKVRVHVAAIVKTYLGMSAYADMTYLSGLIGEEWVANGLHSKTFTRGVSDAMYREIKELPAVVGISRRERALAQLQETFGQSQGAMLVVIVLFAGLIGFGSAINTAFVSLSEREREVGTFRVLGFGPGEVAAILRGELVILGILGTAAGLVAGIGLSHLLAYFYNTELYRFPVVIMPIRLVQAALLMALFLGLAQFVIRRHIGRMDWLEAVKIKE